MKTRARRIAAPVLVLAAWLGLWQIAAANGAISDWLGLQNFLVATPAQIGEVLWQDRSMLASNAGVTLSEVAPGFACALLLGFSAAVVLHLSSLARDALYPLIVASQTIPIVVIAPILVAWFGFGIAPKLVIITLICFFPIAVNTLDGLRSADPEAARMLRTLDASRLQILRRLEIPGALPGLFTGAKIAVAVAVIGAVFGEWAGSSSGLGHLVLQDNAQLNTARMFAAVTVLAVMAMSLFALVAAAERSVLRWR